MSSARQGAFPQLHLDPGSIRRREVLARDPERQVAASLRVPEADANLIGELLLAELAEVK